MFDKMVKMRNQKKGFSLIEMLIVIAIVAILVGVLVPVIGNASVKSRAATNAANLRTVEAELATLRVTKPEYFEDWTLGYVIAVDGKLTFIAGLFSTPLEVDDIPTAKAVEVDVGMDVKAGTQVTVFLDGDEIVATYDSLDGAFDKDDFSEVAQTGKFTGEGRDSLGKTAGKLQDAACDAGIHIGEFTPNGNGTHTCKNCGASDLKCTYIEGVCYWCKVECQHDWGTAVLGYHTCKKCYKIEKVTDSQPAPDTGDSGTGGGTGGTGGDVTPVEHTHEWALTSTGSGFDKKYCHYCTDETCEQHTAHEHNEIYDGIKKICSVCGAQYYGFGVWSFSD